MDDSAQANNTIASNGSAKPRVRARRGQATDPHSIAERVSACLYSSVSVSV